MLFCLILEVHLCRVNAQQCVSEIESGKLSIAEARKIYDIKTNYLYMAEKIG